jgi:hypothetical protein
MAVLPTPGSPTKSGLFLERRHRICMVDLVFTTNQRIDLAVSRLLVEVDTIGLKRVGILFLTAISALALAIAAGARSWLLVLVYAAYWSGFIHTGTLRNPVGDVVHRIIACHVLLLQEECGMTFALGKDGNQDVGTGYFLATGGLHVYHRPLDNSLESGCGL